MAATAYNTTKDSGWRDSSVTSHLLGAVRTTSLLEGKSVGGGIGKKNGRLSFLYISMVLLANSSYVELNPGRSVNGKPTLNSSQTSLPDIESVRDDTICFCGACKEAVTWECRAIFCDSCETWYHIGCQNVNDDTYEDLRATSFVWFCVMCEGPNYSTTLFDLQGVEHENRFSLLGDSSILGIDDIDSQENFKPKHTSSPVKAKPKPAHKFRPLRVINVNCQSLVNKKALFYNLMDSSKPDVVIATETWFNNDIKDAEYFNSNYTIFRRDRVTSTTGGGLIIAVNSEYISARDETLDSDTAEIFGSKSTLLGVKPYT